jgi:hypothetical protein
VALTFLDWYYDDGWNGKDDCIDGVLNNLFWGGQTGRMRKGMRWEIVTARKHVVPEPCSVPNRPLKLSLRCCRLDEGITRSRSGDNPDSGTWVLCRLSCIVGLSQIFMS